jgi:tetrahydromethanopterin S-methyltransferase subunit G
MKKGAKNKEITIDELAIMVAKGFERIDKRFDGIDNKFNQVDKRFDKVEERLDDINYRLSKIEGNHERRLDILEERMATVKTFFEKNPQLKVKF